MSRSTISGIKCIVIPACIVLLVILGGGTPIWVQGGVFVCLGICLLLNPPRVGLGKSLDWVIGGLLFVSLLSLLPAWIMPHGSWREVAMTQYGIVLPWTVASLHQPVFEHTVFLLGEVSFFYLMLSLTYDLGSRRRSVRYMVIFATLLAAFMLLGNSLGLKYIFAEESTIFSYFPNRNQTSTFFCMSAVLAFSWSIISFRCKRYRWAGPAVGCFVILTLAVFASISRAGILLLFIGIFSFFVLKPFSDKPRLFLRVVIPSFVVLVSIVFLLGGPAVYRLETLVAEKSDYRLDVYQDTLGIIADYPLTGVGGGNFRSVFPQYENKAAIDQRLLHPESDWFWFTSEVGLLGLFLLIALVVLLGFRIFPFGRGEHEAVRVIASAALVVFILHSLVDVPAHRMGTLYFAIFLLGLTVSSSKKTAVFYPAWVFRVAGVLLIGSGFLWVLAAFAMPGLHSSTQMIADDACILEAERIQDFALVKSCCDSAIQERPLDWWPYFERAKYYLGEGLIDEADQDFARARFLEPSAQEVAYYEGLSWLSVSPRRAYAAWSEALKREASNREGLYENMRIAVLGHKNVYPYFRKLTLQDPDFRYYYLSVINDADFSKEMDWEFSSGPKLEEFSQERKITLIRRWIRVGGGQSPSLFLELHPGLLDSTPELKAEVLALSGLYEEASLLLFDTELQIPIPEVSESRRPRELIRIFNKSPSDLWVGVSLFRYYLELEEYDNALSVLETLARQGHQPLFVYYWIARLYTKISSYEEAWEAWSVYLKEKEQ